MKTKELKNKKLKELQALLSEKREALRTFRFSIAGSNMRNVKEGSALKKDIAMVLTLLNVKAKVNNE